MDRRSDEELAAAAYVLRTRAKLGDLEALREAKKIEVLLRISLGPTPSDFTPLELGAEPKRPWWRFWRKP